MAAAQRFDVEKREHLVGLEESKSRNVACSSAQSSSLKAYL